MLGTRPGRGALRADVAATPLLILLYEADPAAIPLLILLLILLYEAHLFSHPPGVPAVGPHPWSSCIFLAFFLLPLSCLYHSLLIITLLFIILGYWGGGRRRGAVGFS